MGNTGDNTVDPNLEGNPTPIVEGADTTAPIETEVNGITDEAVLNYFKEKGRDVESIDSLLTVPEPIVEIKEVNPWEDLVDETDRAFFSYAKETGRTRKEFNLLQTNLDEVSPLQFAREQVLKETGMKLSEDQINEYLQDKLNITDVTDLSTIESIDLAKYGKSIKDARIEEQNRYRQPVQPPQENKPTTQDEFVKLANGSVMKKSEYEVIENNHQEYLRQATEAVNRVMASEFKTVIDDNGTPRELNYTYDYSDEDRNSVMSVVSNMDKFIQESYATEQGFNHAKFNEDAFWLSSKNREKAISSIVHKARAEAIEEVLKQRGNVSFNGHDALQNPSQEGIKVMSVKDVFNQRR